jgi:hypothetical protein
MLVDNRARRQFYPLVHANRKGFQQRAASGFCSLAKDERDRWHLQQKGYDGEPWDLFCLDPAITTTRAAETPRDEIALAGRFEDV